MLKLTKETITTANANQANVGYDSTRSKLTAKDESGNELILGGFATQDYRFVGYQRFTADGTYTPTSGVRAIIVELVGGGGAGGGAASSTAGTNNSVGGGGGGGGYAASFITGVTGTYAIDIGAGGTPGAAGSNPGGNGADTTFATTTVVAKGGTGGGAGGASATALGLRGTGGAGGVAGTGDVTMPGEAGYAGVVFSVVAATGMISGKGGNSLMGFGGRSLTASGAGTAGGNYGSGGAGGADASSTNRQGGTGANGYVVIWEFA